MSATPGLQTEGNGGSERQPGTAPRILIVTKRVDLGGAEMHLLRIIPALRSRGIDVSLFVLERGGRLEPDFARSGVEVAGLPRARFPALHLPAAALELARQIRQIRPDAVHYFLPEPYLVGCIATPFMPRHTRIMSRRSLSDYQRKHPQLARIEHGCHRGTAVLLGNSTAVLEELRTEVGAVSAAMKVGLIHNGVAFADPPSILERWAVRQSLGLAKATFAMVIVANLIGYKGHADLIAALAIAAPHLPPDWRLLVVGRDGGIGTALRAQASNGQISQNIIWLGEREDAWALMGASDLAIVASHEEGFSNSLIEAMGCGLPIIATAVGGNVDAIIDRQTGFLVPPRDPKRLANAIQTLSCDAARAMQLGCKARQRATSQFSLETCVTRYERLYRGLENVGQIPIQKIIDGMQSVEQANLV